MLRIFLIFISSIGFVHAQTDPPKPDNSDKKSARYGDKDFFRNKTSLEDPFTMRDPFKAPMEPEITKEDLNKGIMRDGIFTNIEDIGQISLNDLKITGIIVGS